jgi:hypothetical protein
MHLGDAGLFARLWCTAAVLSRAVLWQCSSLQAQFFLVHNLKRPNAVTRHF